MESLIASTETQHPSFARLLHQSLPANEKTWADGSVWFELRHQDQALPLTDEERLLLTGTHPGLPFDVRVEGEEQPYLGLVSFSLEKSLPTVVELNTLVGGKNFLEGKRFVLHVSAPGTDLNWPGWKHIKTGGSDV